jgi:hypothetical protein
LPGLISFTFDAWTSRNGDPFLSMTAHYIAASADDPNDWKLKCDQLAFTPIEGNHSGANMANIILRILDRYEIRHKVRSDFDACTDVSWRLTNPTPQAGWFTSDNAPNNDRTMVELGTVLDPTGEIWDPVERRIR